MVRYAALGLLGAAAALMANPVMARGWRGFSYGGG